MKPTVYAAVLVSHVHAIGSRVQHFARRLGPRPVIVRRGERCPLCGHQLGVGEQRPPRDTRDTRGKMRRLPGEVLTWRRCGGCGLHQIGEHLEAA